MVPNMLKVNWELYGVTERKWINPLVVLHWAPLHVTLVVLMTVTVKTVSIWEWRQLFPPLCSHLSTRLWCHIPEDCNLDTTLKLWTVWDSVTLYPLTDKRKILPIFLGQLVVISVALLSQNSFIIWCWKVWNALFFHLYVCVGKYRSLYLIYFVQMYHMDLYKDILLLMLSRYQPKFSYNLQNWKIVLLSKKKVFVSFLCSIVVQLESALYSFISKFHFWHRLLNPYL